MPIFLRKGGWKPPFELRRLDHPGDPTYNGAILNPLVRRILKKCRKGNANVSVLLNPKVAGFERACGRMPQIMERSRHFNLLVFLADADGKDRSGRFKHIESRFYVNMEMQPARTADVKS